MLKLFEYNIEFVWDYNKNIYAFCFMVISYGNI
jgi:hypothetical protein